MDVSAVATIRAGDTYTYHRLQRVKHDGETLTEDVPLGRYKVVGFAVDGGTRRELVVYKGLDGMNRGRLFVCNQNDFVVKFREGT